MPSDFACARCGSLISRQMVVDAQAALDLAKSPGQVTKLTVMCGDCGALHFRDSDSLRELTAAERFQWEVEAARVAAASERLRRDGSGGVVIGPD